MKNKLVILFVPLLLFISCKFDKNYEVSIDNPSEIDFSFSLNEEKYSVNALGETTLSLKEGKHYFLILNALGDTLLNDTIKVFNDGLLNPTQSTYVVWSDLYLEDFEEYETYAQEVLNIQDSILIDYKEYNDIDFNVFENQIFIPKDWDFGVFEEWPKEIDLYSERVIKKSKIYRLADLEEEWGYWGTFDFNDYGEEEFQQLIDSLLNESDLELDSNNIN
jgi:hypothetical protein